MSVGIDKYKQLVHNISRTHMDYDVLKQLINKYKTIIGSNRVIETITTFHSLLYLLEKRGTLQYNKIDVLKVIIQEFVKDKALEQAIIHYEQWLEQNSLGINNLYNSAVSPTTENISENQAVCRPNVNEQISIKPELSTTQTRPCASTSLPLINEEKELKNLITNQISSKIGKFWADVGRRLNLEESVIEEIELKYFHESFCYEKMFEQVLKLYFSKHHSNWKLELMEALEKSRRKDLKEMIEKIFYKQHSQLSFKADPK